MRRLSPSTLSTVRPGTAVAGYRRESCGVGIVHFGPGAFHRAHQACYIERLLESDPQWAISAVSLRSRAVRDALAPQQFLYTLAELGAGVRLRVISALREILVAPDDGAAVLTRLTAPATRLVTITVTEKGYCLDGSARLDVSHPDVARDLAHPGAPRTLIGWLTEALRQRRAQRIAPFAIVSCDNLPDNGPTLRAAVTAFARHSDADLARWIEDEVAFPRTMVDSITPATDDDLRRRVAEATGLEDAWPVQREAFSQWVIEDLPAVRVADWAAAGVTLTADVGLYDRAKLRLVNGAHSTLAYLGLLRGHDTVMEAMADASLGAFVERLMRLDIVPSLRAAPELDLSSYIDAVLERFRNPHLRHRLAQIAWDGSQKLPVRLFGTLEEARRAGRPLHRLVLPIAAWMRFIVRQAKTDVALVDPHADRLQAVGRACSGEAESDIRRFVSSELLPPALFAAGEVHRALALAYDALSAPCAALPE
jgi:fructuronate reductase